MGININKIITITSPSVRRSSGCRVMVRIYFPHCYTFNEAMPGLKGFVAAVLGDWQYTRAMMEELRITEVMGAAYISSQYRDAAFCLADYGSSFKTIGLLGHIPPRKSIILKKSPKR